MNSYIHTARENILPLSAAKTLPAAFSEWYFTERTIDHEKPIETCELCGQENLRYHFEIANHVTKNQLWVGSHCILRFDVSVKIGGKRLSPDEAKKYLYALTKVMQLRSCANALEALAKSENNRILQFAVDYFRKNESLTPKLAFVVFWKLKNHKIDHNPSFFKIDLKSGKNIRDLREMETSKVHFFWKALSTDQRRKAVALGHTPPPDKGN